MKRSHRQTILALTLGAYASVAATAELVVIVNPANTIPSMSVDQVQQIYLGKTTSLPAGGTASAVDLPDGSQSRDLFYQKASGKSAAQVKAVWARLLFSGKSMPPKALRSSDEVRKFVASNPNGIGYIEKSAADSSVKIVLSLP